MPNEVKEMWDRRVAALNLQNPPEEIEQVGSIYYMGCSDLLDLIRERLARIPPTQQHVWLDGLYDECNNKLEAAFPASLRRVVG